MTPDQVEKFKENPRRLFLKAAAEKDTTTCLIKAAEIHGHFCPGVALGVMASVWGLWEMGVAGKFILTASPKTSWPWWRSMPVLPTGSRR